MGEESLLALPQLRWRYRNAAYGLMTENSRFASRMHSLLTESARHRTMQADELGV